MYALMLTGCGVPLSKMSAIAPSQRLPYSFRRALSVRGILASSFLEDFYSSHRIHVHAALGAALQQLQLCHLYPHLISTANLSHLG